MKRVTQEQADKDIRLHQIFLSSGRGVRLVQESCDLSDLNFRRASLRYGSFKYSDFTGTDFSEANLSHAIMYEADLTKANLTGARIGNADLRWARLSKTKGLHYSEIRCRKTGEYIRAIYQLNYIVIYTPRAYFSLLSSANLHEILSACDYGIDIDTIKYFVEKVKANFKDRYPYR